MKKLIALLAIAATSALATQVPLSLTATGYTELLVPQSISYTAGHEAVADDPATEDIDETAEAVSASFEIEATYQLGYKVPVVDCTIEGVRTVIAPASMPTFDLDMSVPVEAFATFYAGDVNQLISVLQTVGTIKPSDDMTELIRNVAFGILN